MSYTLIRLFFVLTLILGLTLAATPQASAGYTVKRTKITANTRAGNFNTRSNSHANVSNNNSVHITSGGTGGSRPMINRNNGHANKHHNNGNNKKVVRKVIRKDIDINKTVTVTYPNYPYCPDNCYSYTPTQTNTNNNNNYNYNSNKTYVHVTSDGHYYHPGY